jgi:FkbM family methyltransferase
MIGEAQVLMTKIARRALRRWPTPSRRTWVRNHFRKWCTDRELAVHTNYGFDMLASPRDYASYGIYFFGEYDPRMSEVVRRFVRPGDTAWDIGTDRGWFTLLMATLVGPSGHVDSFEAFPDNVRRLRANVALNHMKWVEVHPGAISDGPGSIAFEPPSNDATANLDFLDHCSGAGFITDRAGPRSIVVPMAALDDHASDMNLPRLDFIKMDIEGAELKALRGGAETIARFKPILAIEYNRATLLRAGSSMAELDAQLDAMGYDRFAYRASGFAPVDLAECERKPDAEAVFNVYAFHRAGRRPA